MSIESTLKDMIERGLELWTEGGKLRYRGSKEVITSAMLDYLQENKSEIIQILQNQTRKESVYPLSEGQKALWLVYQLAPESSAYNIVYATYLKHDVDISCLEKAFNNTYERHSILRTYYFIENGEVWQKITDPTLPYFELVDISGWSQEKLDDWLVHEADCPFNLSSNKVLRVNLLKDSLEPSRTILVLTVHHIAVDFWSLELIVNELCLLYNSLRYENEEISSSTPLQYSDYVTWEANHLQKDSIKKLWQYWQDKLSGDLPILDLPTDKPRPLMQTYDGQRFYRDITEELTASIRYKANQEKVTPFIFLLAVFEVLLYRYTGQEDLIIGTPMAGRQEKKFETTVGYFVNPVVLRSDLSGEPTFKELLQRIRQVVLEALDHQDIPFPWLIKELNPRRDNSRSPLFQVDFVWDQMRNLGENQLLKLAKETLLGEKIVSEQRGATLDLTLTFINEADKMQATWEYNTALFEESTVVRMADHFEIILQAVLENSEQKILEIPILTEAERSLLIVEWNNTAKNYPDDKCIHQLFEEQVDKTPNATAVVYRNESLTYQQLNNKANQLAHYLQKLGVEQETLVGICVERSLLMVIGLLGIMKAGGSYVPLDPTYPQERLAYMIADTQISILLTQEHLTDELPGSETAFVCLDRDWPIIAQESTTNLQTKVAPENLVYIIYTSGSTGRPKGVMIEHKSLNNFVYEAIHKYQLSSVDRVLQFASISFDAAAEEIYPCLICGGTLYLRTSDMLSPFVAFFKYCQDWGITVLDLPTAYWHQMVKEVQEITKAWLPESLRLVIIGGEQVLAEAIMMWYEQVKNKSQLVNTYGPTETTVVVSSQYLIDSNTENPKTVSSSIGRPWANTIMYILDKKLNPVPLGVPGELYIGGAGLARGYLNRPDLTQEKFIPNPFSNNPKCRLYKTGDLCRYLSNGNIEYLGRIDAQIKLRGFRIELGEIESVLVQEQEVRDAVVLVREDVLGEPRIIAYLVGQESEANTIRQKLKTKLPDYMIPSNFVWLSALPLTPNDKVDRKALAALGKDSYATKKVFREPRNSLEQQILDIWMSILHIERISIDDNFFELGGHSLLATQIISRIHQSFDIVIPLKTLFESPTVAELSLKVENLTNQNSRSMGSKIQRASRTLKRL